MKISALIGLLMLFLALGCSETDFEPSNPEDFAQDIAAFSKSPLSVHDDIRVQFAFSPDWEPNTEIGKDWFSISPSVSGKMRAISATTASFVPDKPLDPNTRYNIRIDLRKLKPADTSGRMFKFSVKTVRQDFVVDGLEFQSYDKQYHYVDFDLRMADKISSDQAKKLVSAQFSNRALAVKLRETPELSDRFKFRVDSITATNSDAMLSVKYNGQPIHVKRKGEIQFPVAALESFKVLAIKPLSDLENAIAINFSMPLKRQQDFSGLVAIAGASGLRYAVSGNILKVFYEVNPGAETESRVEVFPGIQSAYRKKTASLFASVLDLGEIKPGVRWLKSGSIMPDSEQLRLSFEAVNLSAVDVVVYKIHASNVLQFLQDNTVSGTQNLHQVATPVARRKITLASDKLHNYKRWNAYAIDLSKLIAVDPSAMYRVELGIKPSYSRFKCSGAGTLTDPEETQDEDINYSSYYYYYDDYDWYSEQDPCTSSYYYQKKVGVNLLASNLGVIAKRGLDKSFFFAVSDLRTTQSVAGAKVTLYDYQQQPIANGSTNADGFAHFRPGKYAYFATVTRDESTTYLKLDDEYALSMSTFDVGGEQLQKGLKGYIYTERGVWRPGDTMHVSFVLNDKTNPVPEGHPITLRISDPRGKVTFERTEKSSALHHYSFSVATAQNAATGNWEARVSVGGARFYKALKIETIKPNRLRIRNSLSGKTIYASDQTSNTLTATWLHGAKAGNFKADARLRLQSTTTEFKRYPQFVFDDRTRQFSSDDREIFSGTLSDDGTVAYPVSRSAQSSAPGKLKATLVTKVHEPGGDFSTDVSQFNWSPFASYVGIKVPEADRYGQMATGKPQKFHIAVLSEKGKPMAARNVRVNVYRMDSRWWWDASQNNISQYSAAELTTPYKSYELRTDASGETQFLLEVKSQDWGRYLIRAEELQSGHASATTVFFDWYGAKPDGQSATRLHFATDKTQYEAGQNVKVFIPTPAGSRALLTVESGSRVLKQFWIDAKGSETQFVFPATADMAPNVYLHVSLLQPHASTKSDLPIRQYGVVPIEVYHAQTKLSPQISMPASLRPNDNFKVRVSEKDNRPMTYTLAVVDEGLLDLTNFKTPNAWEQFFKREALGVRTWDIYDEVLGAYGGKINQVFSIGGDANLGGAQAKKANRFKPVVHFLGPFELQGGGRATHSIALGNYVGSVRVMVVGAQAAAAAYGSAEKAVEVKSPLMILASVPRKISPGEKVSVPVTVFASKALPEVAVSIKTSPNIRVTGGRTKSLSFASADEKLVQFELEVSPATGIGTIDVVARSGNERATQSMEIDVMNPNPVTTQHQDFILEPGARVPAKWKPFGQKGSNATIVEVSGVPQANLRGRLAGLQRYPHGCLEQVVSAVFPQLFLPELIDLTKSEREEMTRNVTAGIARVGQSQLSGGGLAYWPGQTYADDWTTSYAGHFLIEAEKRGFALPVGFKAKWRAHQKRAAQQWRFDPKYANDLAQAYRLYTLALEGQQDMGAMNRLRETPGISAQTRFRLGAAYALIGQHEAARSLVSNTPLDDFSERDYFYFGSEARNRAMTLETLLLTGRTKEAFEMARRVANDLASDRWMSTQTTAFSLYAFAKFAQTQNPAPIDIQLAGANQNLSLSTEKPVISRNLKTDDGTEQRWTIANNGKSRVFVRLVHSGILPVGQEMAEARNLSLKQRFVDASGQAVPVTRLTQGSSFYAEITVVNQSNAAVRNIALTQLLPSGLEIVNTRFAENAASGNIDHADLRDDRANYYFSLGARKSRTFRLFVNASYLGRYYFPGAQAEAMYDPDYFVRDTGRWIEIVKQ